MSFTHKMFDFDGRIGRFAYLLYTILNWLVTAILVLAGLVLTRPGLTMIPGILLVVGASVGLIWVNLALTVKRLHDTGRSGAHAIWIALLAVLTAVSASHSSLLALVLAAAIVGVFCWLAYAPGDDGRNLFGPAPDGTLPPGSVGN
jgi:uncharacterized membrane protein YhaH (DUF805 family)